MIFAGSLAATPPKPGLPAILASVFLFQEVFMDVRIPVPFAKSVMERFSGGRLMVEAENGPIIFSQGLFHPLVLDLFPNGATISRGPTPSTTPKKFLWMSGYRCPSPNPLWKGFRVVA